VEDRCRPSITVGAAARAAQTAQMTNKLAPGASSTLGQITEDEPPHGNDVF
jgi:hypothetical protein